MAPGATLVFVHVASGDTGWLRNFGDSVGILEAVDFILDQAGERPCAINISMGRHGGPHDGSTLLELALDHLLSERRGLGIVQSAGNYFERDIHAGGRLRQDQRARLGWLVPDTDTTVNELEIWYPSSVRLDVELRSPDGEARMRVPPGTRRSIEIDGEIVGRAYHRVGDPNNGDTQIDIFLYAEAPQGEWRVTLRNTSRGEARWHAWIERDGDEETQSFFRRGPVSPMMTCGTIAHGRAPIQVAAHSGRRRVIAPFSSAGPSRDGRHLPLLAAPGMRVAAARSSVPGRATTHRESTRKSGTSMAAPYVTGLVALMLEAAPSMTNTQIRGILRRSTRPLGRAPGRQGYLRAVWGAIDAAAAVRRAVALARGVSAGGATPGGLRHSPAARTAPAPARPRLPARAGPTGSAPEPATPIPSHPVRAPRSPEP